MMGVVSECWLAFSVMARTVLFLGAGLVGILLAGIVVLAALAILAAAAGALFDFATDRLARRWNKTGRRPKGRWAAILERGWHDKHGEK